MIAPLRRTALSSALVDRPLEFDAMSLGSFGMGSFGMGSFEIDQIVRREMDSGEKLLWSGQPRQGLLIQASDALVIPFSLMWGGFAIFWEYSVITKGAPLFFWLWGIPFVLVGLYLIIGRFFADSYQRKRTYYAVADKRVLIISGFRNKELKSLPLHGLNELSFKEHSDQRGTIIFGPSELARAAASFSRRSTPKPPMFFMIENGRRVYDLIRQEQARHR
jgi:hypothetical protein